MSIYAESNDFVSARSERPTELEFLIQHPSLGQAVSNLGPFLGQDDRMSKYAEMLKQLGPVVQSIVSLTSLSMVKMLTVLVSTIYNF